MKKIIALLLLTSIGCNSYQKVSSKERINIISELNYIASLDQKYSGLPPEKLLNKYGNEIAWSIFKKERDSVNLDNQKKVKSLYNKYGYLGFDKIGEENSYKFWLPIQHADNDVDFQKVILKDLKKEVKKKNAHKNSYALLTDRVSINTGEKQLFGTQVSYNEYGQAIPKNGLIDSINIEKLRREYDLPTFKDYYNSMTKNHFEMNREMFLKKGIVEPKLYE